MTQVRCSWCTSDPIYIEYHDKEWGRPSKDSQHLFEMLVLESFQAGLSWLTILKRREQFRKAFKNFDAKKIAQFDEIQIQKLLQNEGIIRHRKKIEATIQNAQSYLAITNFSDYIWSFTDGKVIKNNTCQRIVTTQISDALAKDLKKRGFRFMGSTTCYAYMQAIGMADDHEPTCFRHRKPR